MKGRKECGSHTRVGEEKGRSVEMVRLRRSEIEQMAWIRKVEKARGEQ